jgi:hypothetical protein
MSGLPRKKKKKMHTSGLYSSKEVKLGDLTRRQGSETVTPREYGSIMSMRSASVCAET